MTEKLLTTANLLSSYRVSSCLALCPVSTGGGGAVCHHHHYHWNTSHHPLMSRTPILKIFENLLVKEVYKMSLLYWIKYINIFKTNNMNNNTI